MGVAPFARRAGHCLVGGADGEGIAMQYVSDGGLETDLIYHHGVDLPHFAAYVLLRDAHGRDLLRHYY